jgi:hypothetical protein
MIPPQKMAAVIRALQQTFGVADFDDIRPMTKGHTQLIRTFLTPRVQQQVPQLLADTKSAGNSR